MYWVIWLGIIILSLVVQTVCGNILTVYEIKPDLLLVIIIIFSFKHSTFESGLIGFIAGILQDSSSGINFGINAFTKLIIGLITSNIKKVYAENSISISLSIFVFTLIQSLLIFAFQSTISMVGISTINRCLFIALYNTLLGILVFPIIRKVKTG
ncbi:MAG: rod shape-determining protein MreD [bacterium]|nr:rod shape-determining protein MreD [bacterium]